MNEIIYTVGMTLEQLEKLVILKAFAHFRFNKTSTAISLGIAIRTLDNKLEKYAYEEEQERTRLETERARRDELLAKARGNPPNNVGIPYSPNVSSSLPMNTIINTGVKTQAPAQPEKPGSKKGK